MDAALGEALVELIAQGVARGLSRAQQPATEVQGDQPVVLTARQADDAFGLSDQAIYDLMNRGELPEVRLGRRRFVPRIAVSQILERSMAGWDAESAAGALGFG